MAVSEQDCYIIASLVRRRQIEISVPVQISERDLLGQVSRVIQLIGKVNALGAVGE
jgi:hypothetical protein